MWIAASDAQFRNFFRELDFLTGTARKGSAAQDGVAIDVAVRYSISAQDNRSPHASQGWNPQITKKSERCLNDGYTQPCGCLSRLECGNWSVDCGIWTLDGWKEKNGRDAQNSQNGDNDHNGHFRSDSAQRH